MKSSVMMKMNIISDFTLITENVWAAEKSRLLAIYIIVYYVKIQYYVINATIISNIANIINLFINKNEMMPGNFCQKDPCDRVNNFPFQILKINCNTKIYNHNYIISNQQILLILIMSQIKINLNQANLPQVLLIIKMSQKITNNKKCTNFQQIAFHACTVFKHVVKN